MWEAQSPQQLSWGSCDQQCHAKGQLHSKMHRGRNKTNRKLLKMSVPACPRAALHTLDYWQESGAIPADIRSSFTLWTPMDFSLGLVNQSIMSLVTLNCRKGRFSASLSCISTWCYFKEQCCKDNENTKCILLSDRPRDPVTATAGTGGHSPTQTWSSNMFRIETEMTGQLAKPVTPRFLPLLFCWSSFPLLFEK